MPTIAQLMGTMQTLLAELQKDPGNQQLMQQMQLAVAQLQIYFLALKGAMG